MILEDHERRRFIEWLDQNAMSSDLLAKQMDTLPAAAGLAKQMRFEAAACTFLANKLRNTESYSVGGENAG